MVPSSIVRNFSSPKVINKSSLLSMLNSTCVTSEATQGQERLPSIRKKPPVWHCKPNSTVMYYDIILGRLTTVDREITVRCIALLNQADPDMLQFMQYNINQCDASKGETYRLAKEFGQKLIDNTREVIRKPPMYNDGGCINISSFLIINSCF